MGTTTRQAQKQNQATQRQERPRAWHSACQLDQPPKTYTGAIRYLHRVECAWRKEKVSKITHEQTRDGGTSGGRGKGEKAWWSVTVDLGLLNLCACSHMLLHFLLTLGVDESTNSPVRLI